MFSPIMTNQETIEHFNVNYQTKLAQPNPVAQHPKFANKRPSGFDPLPYKRYKKNSFSQSDEVFETASLNSFDPYLSCASSTSNISSPNQSQPQEENQEQQQFTDEPSVNSNKHRLLRTTEMLKESGLYDVAVRTAALIRQNQQSHKDLQDLKEETKLFLRDVLRNPENHKINQILNGLHQGQ